MKPRYNVLKIFIIIGGVVLLAAGCGQSFGGSYSNTLYNYSIKYPSGWMLHTLYDGSGQDIGKAPIAIIGNNVQSTKSNFRLFITIEPNPSGETAEQWFSDSSAGDGIWHYPADAVLKSEDSSVQNNPAYKVTITGDAGYVYYIPHNGNIFILAFQKYPGPNADPSAPDQDFDFMLNNFKFTD